MALKEFFFARQPILDRERNLVAYELLFRNGPDNRATIVNERQATLTVVRNLFLELGMAEALGAHKGLLNVSADLLLDDLIFLLPRNKLVFELLETIKITPAIIKRCKELYEAGYKLALDDVVGGESFYELRPLFPFVELIKIDVMDMTDQQLEMLVEELKPLNKKLLAEKVDNNEQYQRCLELGFDLFQGFFFARPTLMRGARVVHNDEAQILRLLGLCTREAEMAEIESVFKQSLSLTLSLLRLVNSVASGIQNPVSSLRGAILLLGRDSLRRWVQLLVFLTGRLRGDGRAEALYELAATRGRMMELLSLKRYPNDAARADCAFMTGLLSLVDALLDRSLEEVLDSTGVSDEVRAALLRHEGVIGRMLDEVIATDGGMCPPELACTQIEALRWVGQTYQFNDDVTLNQNDVWNDSALK